MPYKNRILFSNANRKGTVYVILSSPSTHTLIMIFIILINVVVFHIGIRRNVEMGLITKRNYATFVDESLEITLTVLLMGQLYISANEQLN